MFVMKKGDAIEPLTAWSCGCKRSWLNVIFIIILRGSLDYCCLGGQDFFSAVNACIFLG